MSPSATLPPDEAAKTLERVRTVKERTEVRLDPYWFPLVVYGALTFVSQWFFGVWDGAGLAVYWLVAIPIALIATAYHRRGEAQAVGAARRGRPYAVAMIAFAAACIVFGTISAATGETDLVHYGPPLAIAAALAFEAARRRSLRGAAWALGATALVAWAIIRGFDGFAETFALGMGTVSVVDGFTERNRLPSEEDATR